MHYMTKTNYKKWSFLEILLQNYTSLQLYNNQFIVVLTYLLFCGNLLKKHKDKITACNHYSQKNTVEIFELSEKRFYKDNYRYLCILQKTIHTFYE